MKTMSRPLRWAVRFLVAPLRTREREHEAKHSKRHEDCADKPLIFPVPLDQFRKERFVPDQPLKAFLPELTRKNIEHQDRRDQPQKKEIFRSEELHQGTRLSIKKNIGKPVLS